jgi:hypothetical protein
MSVKCGTICDIPDIGQKFKLDSKLDYLWRKVNFII